MRDWFLEKKINIKFCVKLGKNAGDICAMLSETYRGEAMKKSSVLSGINCSRACMLKSLMKTVLITFFNVKGIDRFEFIP
jgi:hypothetical protein